MKSINRIGLFFGVAAIATLSSCVSEGEDPGVEYAPDMYVSKGYEPYSQVEDAEGRSITFKGEKYSLYEDGKSMRTPDSRTVARGKADYYFPYAPGSESEKQKAGNDLTNPVELTQKNLEEGRRHYNINCAPCHGGKGLGDGLVAEKYPPNYIPSYKTDRIHNLKDGSIYYAITHGWNLMGAYGRVLTPTERWQIVHYVNYLEAN